MDKKNITIKDIARYCGVGVTTVSRVINDDTGVAPETKEKVMAAVERYNYVPNSSARNLKMAESNTVALIVCGVDNIFFSSMYGDFQRELEKNGYDFLLYAVTREQDIAAEAVSLTKEKRLKGVVFLGGYIDVTSQSLKDLNVPYVFCTVSRGFDEPHPPCPMVCIDDVVEAKKIVDYLCDCGHKRIAIVAGVKGDKAVGGDRLYGYRKSLEEHGILCDENLVRHMKEDVGEFTAENGYEVTKELIREKVDFSAIFCISDLTAIGVYRALYDEGYRIPEDVSVVGFDGIELGTYMHPRVTTVSQPRHEMVSESVRLLMKEIHTGKKGEDVIFEAKLIERESVQNLFSS